MILEKDILAKTIFNLLEEVYDPEIPVISIIDLGIVRDVILTSSPLINVKKDVKIEIIITPTYSGCPAMDMISMEIRLKLLQNGFKNIKITQQLSPAWTTKWITKHGREKLSAYGIAPPQSEFNGHSFERMNKMLFPEKVNVECPQCHSKNTKLLSEFGSTSCKAMYQCNDCKEPFDYFKCH